MEATFPPIPETAAAIKNLRAALAQPEQEPVAWLRQRDNTLAVNDGGLFGSDWTPLYTAPPQRKPLTDEKVYALVDATLKHGRCALARAIERAHGIGGES
jgi:hypothetical protein